MIDVVSEGTVYKAFMGVVDACISSQGGGEGYFVDQ